MVCSICNNEFEARPAEHVTELKEILRKEDWVGTIYGESPKDGEFTVYFKERFQKLHGREPEWNELLLAHKQNPIHKMADEVSAECDAKRFEIGLDEFFGMGGWDESDLLNLELKMSIPVVVDDSEPDEYAVSLPPGPERSRAMRDWEFSFHEGPNEYGEWDGDEDGFFEENKEEVCLDCVTELSVIYNGYDETRIILKSDSQCSDCESTLCFNEKFEIIGKVVKGENYCNRCVAKRIDSLKKKISNLQGSIDEEVENIYEEIQEFGGKVDDDSFAGLGALFG